MYLNIHSHSIASEKDALPEPRVIAKRCKELGNKQFCITDHGNISGWIQAYKAAKDLDMQFIPGCEFYLLPEDEYWSWNTKHNDDVETVDFATKYHHLLVLAKNQTGVRSLIKIYNTNQNHYGKPCITRKALFDNSEGLIVTTACVAGEIPYYIINNKIDKAREILKMYYDKFGDDFYCELQYHNLDFIDEQKVYGTLIKLARELKIHYVATTDSHFVYKDDVEAHNIYKTLFYNGDKAKYNFKDRKWNNAFSGDGYYIKDENEIRETIRNISELTDAEVEYSISNSMEIANKCEETHFPGAKELVDKNKELRNLVEVGFNKIRKGTPEEEESRRRIENELEVIKSMGFSEYFINVYSIVKRSEMLNILVGAGRGSGPGSEVNFLLGITKIDPIKWNLIFERFLNPSRWNYPDIDLDIQTSSNRKGYTGKDIVLESLSKDKFPFTGQIQNEVRLTTLTAFKYMARAFDISYKDINKLTTDSTVAEKYFMEDEYTGWLETELKNKNIVFDEKWKEMEQYIWFCYKYGGHDGGDKAHGLIWNRSIHASGCILYPYKDKDILPKNPDNSVIYRGHDLEAMGYIKYDLLSLDALNAINVFIPRIEKDTGKKFNWEDTFDEKTWNVFKEADTNFVFQFSSDGMKRALKVIQPENIDTLAELNSLFRPGCISAGIFDRYLQNAFTPEEKVVGKFLKEEFGEQHSTAMIFQEDILKTVQKMSNFTLAEADLIRRAMARKEKETMDSYKKQFIDNFKVDKYGDIAETVWNTIESFATYTFNRSHAVAYSCIAYWTAYLFANYKDEYLQYLMNTNKTQRNIITGYLMSNGYSIVYPSLITQNTEWVVYNNKILIPTVAVQKERTAGEYLLNLDTNKNKMITKYGLFDGQCADRKGLRDLFKALDKKKLKNLTSTQRDKLYELNDIKEIIRTLAALDFLDYSPGPVGDAYVVDIKKARSVKTMNINFSVTDELLQNNAQEDVRAYGIVREQYCDRLEGYNYDIISKKFAEFFKRIITNKESEEELTRFQKNEYFKKFMSMYYYPIYKGAGEVKRTVCKTSKVYERWGTATLIFANCSLEAGIMPRLLPFFKKLSANTPISVQLRLNAYFNAEGTLVLRTTILDAKPRSF